MHRLHISPQRNKKNDQVPSITEEMSNIKKLLPKEASSIKKTIDNKTNEVSATDIIGFKYIDIKSFYYINKNNSTRLSLKNGRRIFHNKTDLASYDSNDIQFNQSFIEFRQLFFENLLLNEDFSENLKEKLTIQSALFSTFVYDSEFIEPLINTFKLKSIIVRHRENTKYNQMEEHESYIKFVYPKLDYTLKWGKFHSKLILLKFPSFLRVVVPSANLTNGDWYYWGQIIWFQDFPLKKTTNEETKHNNNDNDNDNEAHVSKEDDNDFAQYLNVFLKEFMPNGYEGKRFWTDLNINIFDYDYSECVIDLIASSNGRFKNKEKFQFGVGRLIDLIDYYKEQRPSIKTNDGIMIQCSSIGKGLRNKFLTDFSKAFNLTSDFNMSIIYPTEEYINSFPLGKELSSCLFLTLDIYQLHKDKFKVIELKKGYESRQTVFHSKCFITYSNKQQEEKEVDDGITDDSIIYFGSHNFSVAAWGSFEKSDSQISIANYELGIVFDPIKITYEEKKSIYNSLILNMNSRHYSQNDYPFLNDFST